MITWIVENMERRQDDGFVTNVHWRANAQDGSDKATVYGSCNLGAGELVTPFENLTEAKVLEWVWAIEDKDSIEQNLLGQINAKKVKESAKGLPW